MKPTAPKATLLIPLALALIAARSFAARPSQPGMPPRNAAKPAAPVATSPAAEYHLQPHDSLWASSASERLKYTQLKLTSACSDLDVTGLTECDYYVVEENDKGYSPPSNTAITPAIATGSQAMSVDFSPRPVLVSLNGSASVTATIIPTASTSQVTFDTAYPTIAKVSGTAPNLTLTAVGSGTTQLRASTNGAVVASVSVTVASLSLSFDPAHLTDGLARACAGALDDPLHEVTLHAHVTQNGAAAVNLQIAFSVQNPANEDYHRAIRPQFKTVDGPTARFSDTLTLITDANGDTSFTIRSSNVKSQPLIVAMVGGQQVGSVTADFADAISIRRFPNPTQPDETEDTGWLFNSPANVSPGDVTPAKVYLKFMKDPATGDKDGNWSYANGHQLIMQINQVTLTDGTVVTGTPAQLSQYAFVMDTPHGPSVPGAVTATVTTSNDGAAQAYVQAGPKIAAVAHFQIVPIDQTDKQ